MLSYSAMGVLISLAVSALGGALLLLARRRREQTFRDATQFRLAVESADDAILIESLDGFVRSWNPAAELLLGYNADELIGTSVMRLLPEDRQGEESTILGQVRAGQRVSHFETVRRRRDGSLVDVSLTVSPIRDRSGTVVGASQVMRNITERKHAAMQIRTLYAQLEEQVNLRSGQLQSVQRDLATILDALPSMIGYWDKDLINRIANRGFAKFFDVNPVLLPGTHMRKLLGDELFERALPHMEAALRGETVTFEQTLPARSGAGATHMIVHFVPDIAYGGVKGFYALGHDITEITESKHQLALVIRENDGLLSTLHQHALVSTTDCRGRITDVNAAFCAISGYTREELLGQDHQILSSGAHPAEFWRDLWSHIGSGKPWRGEVCNRAKNGSMYWVDSIIAPIFDEDGAIIKYISIRFDISAHKEAQRRLMESESFLQRVERVSGVGGFMLELSSNTQRWTRQSYRIHDLEEERAPTLELVDKLLSPEVRDRMQASIRSARESGTGYDIETPITTAAGRPIWIRTVGEVESERGVPVRIVGAVQDITVQRRMERQLRDAIAVAEKANKAKSEFLANVSHEIRTPLNAVIGLGYLLEQTTLSEEQQQFLTKIQFAGRALLSVVNNVLDLSKIEAGEMPLEDEPFDLPDLLREVSQMLAAEASGKGIELASLPDAMLPRMVMGDGLRLRQILTNLMSNSIKFTEAGRVELKIFCTERGSDRVRLRCEVSDTGVGIEPAALERLFTPFTQADTSTTRRFGGTGLGLSIARRFVELMGGEIGVRSSVGVGSTFWFEVPLRIASKPGRSIGAQSLRIFIADPNGDAPQGAGAMVRALGWSPHIVESGEQLLAALNHTEPHAWPDVLMLELHLQDMDAHQLIARLEQECAGGELPPVIVVIDAAQSYLRQQQLMRDSDILLVRPLTSSALFNAVNAAVSRRPVSHERVLQCTNFDERHAQWLAGVRVLVVDDSDINVEVARRILVKQGATVACCSDGASAVEHVRAWHAQLDVVLMDVQMPILDGNGATRRIREELNLHALPIIALTAGALVGERQRSLDAGMSDFISKPFDPLALIRTVRGLVEQARGASIPMVILAGQPDDAGTKPFIASIDAAVVQQMFGEDRALFESLLKRMLREYADFALPLAVGSDQGLRGELKARAHKLKGSAGMIGASSVARFAGAAETALQNDRPADVVERILRQLAQALTTLREEARPLLGKSPETAAAAAADIDPTDIEELSVLLESQNLAAVDKFSSLSPSLHAMLDTARFERLRSAVDDLDFQLGAELLRKAVAVG
jgi:PAS domain S-box-containing protein